MLLKLTVSFGELMQITPYRSTLVSNSRLPDYSNDNQNNSYQSGILNNI